MGAYNRICQKTISFVCQTTISTDLPEVKKVLLSGFIVFPHTSPFNMGNQESRTEGLILDKKSIEVPEGWTMLKARMQHSNPQLLSLFSTSPQSKPPEILELAGKNLMLHRHPNIVKYVSSWHNQEQYCVLTERVWPLSLALEKQTPTQICAGLHSILKALVFLHEKAESSHNNVCCSTIYVTTDGSWKLGGFEHLLRFVDCTLESLSKFRPTRDERIIPPEEKSRKEIIPYAVDAFAFGVLAEQVIDGLSDEDQCGLREFRDLARELQHDDPTCRPALSSLLNLTFFQNPFLLIHDFLTELPMKTESEKDTFFNELLDTLRTYPQVLVAKHLAELLLSRMVVLDHRAGKYLLPALLCTTGAPSDANDTSDDAKQLFSREVFQKYVVPRLLKMFQVHDTQIRLVLLNHFKNYCFVFSKEQLVGLVLPEVMLGLKDKNDVVVTATLKALAALVPILGGAVVLGGKQCKIFSDCLPSDARLLNSSAPSGHPEEQKLKKHMSGSGDIDSLPERPSPDGGEDVSSTGPTDEETDLWSDWDAEQHFNSYRTDSPVVANEQWNNEFIVSTKEHSKDDRIGVVAEKCERTSWSGGFEEDQHSRFSLETTRKAMSVKPLSSAVRNVQKRPLPDITSLDIKSSVSVSKSGSADEFDFFRDMEPIIAKTEPAQPLPTEQSCNKTVSRFDMDLSVKLEVDNDASGWCDGTDDWSDIE